MKMKRQMTEYTLTFNGIAYVQNVQYLIEFHYFMIARTSFEVNEVQRGIENEKQAKMNKNEGRK